VEKEGTRGVCNGQEAPVKISHWRGFKGNPGWAAGGRGVEAGGLWLESLRVRKTLVKTRG
jgi:hypothetical protein